MNLTKQTNESDIKKYFEKILELKQSNQEFPVNLDEVWELVYKEKGAAVRALRRANFLQGVDYQFFDILPKNSKTGRPEQTYMLSVECLEYFIANKSIPAYEIYKTVFDVEPKLPAVANINTDAMSSLDIAKITGKRHDNVIIDIEKMFYELKIQCPDFSGYYNDSRGRPQKMYKLPKRECLGLVSGYNVKLRFKIIDRWAELEANKQPTVAPKEEKAIQALDVSSLQLQVSKLIKIVESVTHAGPPTTPPKEDRLYSIGEVAKSLNFEGIGQKILFRILRDTGMLYYDNGHNLPQQKYINQGYMKVQWRDIEVDSFTYGKITKTTPQVFATAKGVDYIEKGLIKCGYTKSNT